MPRIYRAMCLLMLGALGLMPAMLHADDAVRIEKDVAYLGPDRNEKGDLYLPAKVTAGKRLPAVVIIHGGGWSGGEKGAKRPSTSGIPKRHAIRIGNTLGHGSG